MSSSNDPANDCLILNHETLQKEMNDLINEVSDIAEIPHGPVRILLNHFKWDKEILLERFYESSNTEEFLRRARLCADPANMGDGVEGKEMECIVCYSVSLLTGLACRHYACNDCYATYLTTKLVEENASVINCFYPGCKLLVDDEHLLSLIGNNQAAMKAFNRLSLNGFVENSKVLRWCTGAGCEMAIKVAQKEAREVQCSCKSRFCFECGLEHELVNCRLLKLWIKKCEDDSETSNWLVAHTKECPKCHAAIEKNEGCNHMTCTKCSYHFCWVCLGHFADYKHACNRFDESKANDAKNAQESARVTLERYLHYYNRFMNHQKSMQLENKLYASVQAKMDFMEANNLMSWVEVQFLMKAVEILSQCRRTLMYTYAFAFFLKKSNISTMFEDNQQDLESATEQLSALLERDMEEELAEFENKEKLVELKQKVQDKYRYVEHRRTVLLKHCAEGYEKDSWQFNH